MKTITCSRCGGSGRHSFNLRDGDVCYGCSGSGTQTVSPAQIARAEKARAGAAVKSSAREEMARLKIARQKALLPTLEAKFGQFTEAVGAYRFFGICEVLAKRGYATDLDSLEAEFGQ